MNPILSLIRRYTERAHQFPVPKKVRASFADIHEDKFMVIQEIYTLHKHIGIPEGKTWATLEELCNDIVKGYNPDNDFLFIVDRKDRITVTRK